MGTDHGILCPWTTPDLISRDQNLRARTVVCGMSRNAITIHIVALMLTSGTSLPINLLFGIRQKATYNKIKHERLSIRQILAKRNVVYLGRGQWMFPQVMHPGPAPGPWMVPNGGQGVYSNPGPGPGPWMPHGGQRVHPNPSPGPGPWMVPNGGQHVPPNVMNDHQHWADPHVISSDGTGQSADPNAWIYNIDISGFQDQFAQAAQSTLATASQYISTN